LCQNPKVDNIEKQKVCTFKNKANFFAVTTRNNKKALQAKQLHRPDYPLFFLILFNNKQ